MPGVGCTIGPSNNLFSPMVPSMNTNLFRLRHRFRQNQAMQKVPAVLIVLGAILAIGWAPIDDSDLSVDSGEPAPAETESPEKPKFEFEVSPFKDLVDSREDERVGGDVPYIPTRLEWLALQANSMLRRNAWAEHGYLIHFAPGPRGSDTVKVVVTYHTQRADQKRMDAEVGVAQQAVQISAENLGWSSWLKVEVEKIPKG